jgi:hypothetical protein
MVPYVTDGNPRSMKMNHRKKVKTMCVEAVKSLRKRNFPGHLGGQLTAKVETGDAVCGVCGMIFPSEGYGDGTGECPWCKQRDRRVVVPTTGLPLDASSLEVSVLAAALASKLYTHPTDFHTATAAKMFSVDAKDVTPKQRSTAELYNFCGLYGQEGI